MDNLDAKNSGLLTKLFQARVISVEDKESIDSEATSAAQNEKLLSMLSRKTRDQFDKFLNALDTTSQFFVRGHITTLRSVCCL